jgi:hypothetical protein
MLSSIVRSSAEQGLVALSHFTTSQFVKTAKNSIDLGISATGRQVTAGIGIGIRLQPANTIAFPINAHALAQSVLCRVVIIALGIADCVISLVPQGGETGSEKFTAAQIGASDALVGRNILPNANLGQ